MVGSVTGWNAAEDLNVIRAMGSGDRELSIAVYAKPLVSHGKHAPDGLQRARDSRLGVSRRNCRVSIE